uniref:Uncharacterized protein n=1 Tax=Tanacetum cinerariifolium TaxID=118510 RepID=A0A699GG18_TANCI|nr:conserved hypothetical protein [Tanacetum cinerariifolium]
MPAARHAAQRHAVQIPVPHDRPVLPQPAQAARPRRAGAAAAGAKSHLQRGLVPHRPRTAGAGRQRRRQPAVAAAAPCGHVRRPHRGHGRLTGAPFRCAVPVRRRDRTTRLRARCCFGPSRVGECLPKKLGAANIGSCPPLLPSHHETWRHPPAPARRGRHGCDLPQDQLAPAAAAHAVLHGRLARSRQHRLRPAAHRRQPGLPRPRARLGHGCILHRLRRVRRALQPAARTPGRAQDAAAHDAGLGGVFRRQRFCPLAVRVLPDPLFAGRVRSRLHSRRDPVPDVLVPVAAPRPGHGRLPGQHAGRRPACGAAVGQYAGRAGAAGRPRSLAMAAAGAGRAGRAAGRLRLVLPGRPARRRRLAVRLRAADGGAGPGARRGAPPRRLRKRRGRRPRRAGRPGGAVDAAARPRHAAAGAGQPAAGRRRLRAGALVAGAAAALDRHRRPSTPRATDLADGRAGAGGHRRHAGPGPRLRPPPRTARPLHCQHGAGGRRAGAGDRRRQCAGLVAGGTGAGHHRHRRGHAAAAGHPDRPAHARPDRHRHRLHRQRGRAGRRLRTGAGRPGAGMGRQRRPAGRAGRRLPGGRRTGAAGIAAGGAARRGGGTAGTGRPGGAQLTTPPAVGLEYGRFAGYPPATLPFTQLQSDPPMRFVLPSATLAALVSTALTAALASAHAAAVTPAVPSPLSSTPITLDQAMANPDWIGTPVEAAWWGWDSRQVYYKQKRAGSPLRDTYLVATGGAKQVGDQQLANLDTANPVYNRDHTRAIVLRNGDLRRPARAVPHRQRLVQLEPQRAPGVARGRAAHRQGSGRQARSGRPARPATAPDFHPGAREARARRNACPARRGTQRRRHPRAETRVPGRESGNRIERAVTERPLPAGSDQRQGCRQAPRGQDAALRDRIRLRGNRRRAQARERRRSRAAQAAADRHRHRQDQRPVVRRPARHRRRSAGRDARRAQARPAQGQPPAAFRAQRRIDPLERRRRPRGRDGAGHRQQGPLDRHRGPGRRHTATAAPADGRGLGEQPRQRLRLAAGQPHAVVPVRGKRLRPPLPEKRADARRRATGDYLGQMGNQRRHLVGRRQDRLFHVQPQAAGHLRSLFQRREERRRQGADRAGRRGKFYRVAGRPQAAGALLDVVHAGANRHRARHRRRGDPADRHPQRRLQGAHLDRTANRGRAVHPRRRPERDAALPRVLPRADVPQPAGAARLHRAGHGLSGVARLWPQLAHGDLPPDGPPGTGRLHRRLELAGGQPAGRRQQRGHLRRQLRRLHDLHGAAARTGPVQGRRRAAARDRLDHLQPRVHGQHPQHAGAGPGSVQGVVADRIRGQPEGSPPDRPRHGGRQCVLPGLGAHGAALHRAEKGQLGTGLVSAGTPRIRACGKLVRPVPPHLPAVRAHAQEQGIKKAEPRRYRPCRFWSCPGGSAAPSARSAPRWPFAGPPRRAGHWPRALFPRSCAGFPAPPGAPRPPTARRCGARSFSACSFPGWPVWPWSCRPGPPSKTALVLVQAMRARALRAVEHAADAIGPDAGVVEEAAVRAPGGHGGDHGHARPHVVADLLDGLHQRWRQRRHGGGDRLTDAGDLDVLIAHHALQRGLHLVDRLAGQDAAVDGGARPLRQRVVGVARLHPGGHARGAHGGVMRRADRVQAVQRGLVGRVLQDGLHVGRDLPLLDGGHALVERARDGRQLERERELSQLRQAIGQAVDGVVAVRRRTVAARIGDLELEALVGFFAGLDTVPHRLAVLVEQAAAAFVERQFGVDQRTVMLEQVIDTVEFRRHHFLVARQRQHQVALGRQLFLLVADHVGHERRCHGLVVRGAARIKHAVFFHQLERIAHPVLAVGLHHVHVGQQQQRSAAAVALQARHQVALGGRAGRHDDLHVGIAKAAGLETPGDLGDGRRARAGGMGGVGFHQLLRPLVAGVKKQVHRAMLRRCDILLSILTIRRLVSQPMSHTPVPPPLALWGGVEATVNRVGERYFSQMELNGHDARLDDLDRFATLGITALRYPVLWELVAPDGLAHADWRWPDERLHALRERGITPIAGLVHHGSGPRHTSLIDPDFATGLAEYAGAVAQRYPWLDYYTPVNEPCTTARFSCLYGLWHPHRQDDASFVRAVLVQCKATVLAMQAIRAVNPQARLVQTDDLGKAYGTAVMAEQIRFTNHRRWLGWDLLCGMVGPDHALWRYLLKSGATEEELLWFRAHPCPPDVVGINYYITSERWLDHRIELYDDRDVGAHGYADVAAARSMDTPCPGIAPLLHEAWERYGLPLVVTEAHLDAQREDQVRWLHEIWQGAQQARQAGADVRAVTVWALLGAFDWNSLVTHRNLYYESGAFDLRSPQPRATAVATLMRELAAGQPPSSPALDGQGWWRHPERLLHAATDGEPGGELDGSADGKRERGPARPILISSGGGKMGNAFAQLCAERHLACIVLTRQQMDTTDAASVNAALARHQPWAVINTSGYVHAQRIGNDAAPGQRINDHAARGERSTDDPALCQRTGDEPALCQRSAREHAGPGSPGAGLCSAGHPAAQFLQRPGVRWTARPPTGGKRSADAGHALRRQRGRGRTARAGGPPRHADRAHQRPVRPLGPPQFRHPRAAGAGERSHLHRHRRSYRHAHVRAGPGARVPQFADRRRVRHLARQPRNRAELVATGAPRGRTGRPAGGTDRGGCGPVTGRSPPQRPGPFSLRVMHYVAVRGAHAWTHPAAAAVIPPTRPLVARLVPIILAPPRAALHARRPLQWDHHISRHRSQVERAADEAAQADHQFGRVDRAPCCQVGRCGARQSAMFFRSQQQDVGQCGFHCIADAAGAVGAGLGIRLRRWLICWLLLCLTCWCPIAQVAQMGGIDGQLSRKRTTQRAVSRHQRFHPLVDLPVHALAALLDGLHHQDADAHADQGKQRQPDQGGHRGLPRTEIHISHSLLRPICSMQTSVPGPIGPYVWWRTLPKANFIYSEKNFLLRNVYAGHGLSATLPRRHAARYQGKSLRVQGRDCRHHGRAGVRLRHGRDLGRVALHEHAHRKWRPRPDPGHRGRRHVGPGVWRGRRFADGRHAVGQVRPPHHLDGPGAGVPDRRAGHDAGAVRGGDGGHALRARAGRRRRVVHGAGIHCRNGRPQPARPAGQPERADDRQRPADRVHSQRGARAFLRLAPRLALHAGHCRRAGDPAGTGHAVRAGLAALAGKLVRRARHAVDPQTAVDRYRPRFRGAIYGRKCFHVFHADHFEIDGPGHQRRVDRHHRQRRGGADRDLHRHLADRQAGPPDHADVRSRLRRRDPGCAGRRVALHARRADEKLCRAGVHLVLPAVHADADFARVLAADVRAVPDAFAWRADRHGGGVPVGIQWPGGAAVPGRHGAVRQRHVLRVCRHQCVVADLCGDVSAGNQGQVAGKTGAVPGEGTRLSRVTGESHDQDAQEVRPAIEVMRALPAAFYAAQRGQPCRHGQRLAVVLGLVFLGEFFHAVVAVAGQRVSAEFGQDQRPVRRQLPFQRGQRGQRIAAVPAGVGVHGQHVELVGQRVLDVRELLAVHLVAFHQQRRAHQTGGVERAHVVGHGAVERGAGGRDRRLVPHAPQHHGGAVAVAVDGFRLHRQRLAQHGRIFPVHGPVHGNFAPDQQPHFVGQAQRGFRMRVVRQPHVVGAQAVLDFREQRARRLLRHVARRIGAKLFLVQRDAAQENRFAIEQDLRALDGNGAKADAVLHAVGSGGEADVVERGRVRRPALQLGRRPDIEHGAAMGVGGGAGSSQCPDRHVDHLPDRLRALQLHGAGDAAVQAQAERGVVDKGGRGGDQAHGAGDAAIDIPVGDGRGNRLRIMGGIGSHAQAVVAGAQGVGHFQHEGRKTALVAADFLAVQVHIRAIVDRLEAQKGALAVLLAGVELALEPHQAVVIAQRRRGGVPGARDAHLRTAVEVEFKKIDAAFGFLGGDIDVAVALHARLGHPAVDVVQAGTVQVFRVRPLARQVLAVARLRCGQQYGGAQVGLGPGRFQAEHEAQCKHDVFHVVPMVIVSAAAGGFAYERQGRGTACTEMSIEMEYRSTHRPRCLRGEIITGLHGCPNCPDTPFFDLAQRFTRCVALESAALSADHGPSSRTSPSRRLAGQDARRLRLRRRRRVRGPAPLQPARAQQRFLHPAGAAGRDCRRPRARQAVFCRQQYLRPQRQAQNLFARYGAGDCHGARCADHGRSRPDHDGARPVGGRAGPPVGAGQRRQLGRCEILAPHGPDARDPVARTVARRNRGNPPAVPGDGAGSLRAWRAVHRLLGPLPAVGLFQPPRFQPGHVHQLLPLGLQGKKRQRGRQRRPGRGSDAGNPAALPAGAARSGAAVLCAAPATAPPAGRPAVPDRGSRAARPADAGPGRRTRHLHHEFERPARGRAHRTAGKDRRRFAQDRRPHQVAVLRGAHGPGVPPGHRRRGSRPPVRRRPAGPVAGPGQSRLHGRLLPAPPHAGAPELSARRVGSAPQPVRGRRAGRCGRLGAHRRQKPFCRGRPHRGHPSARQPRHHHRAHAGRRWRGHRGGAGQRPRGAHCPRCGAGPGPAGALPVTAAQRRLAITTSRYSAGSTSEPWPATLARSSRAPVGDGRVTEIEQLAGNVEPLRVHAEHGAQVLFGAPQQRRLHAGRRRHERGHGTEYLAHETGRGPVGQADTPAATHHAQHFAGRARMVGREHGAERGQRHVEAAVAERQLLGVRLAERDVESFRCRAGAAFFQQRRHVVGGRDAGEAAGGRQRCVAVAGSDVDHAFAGADVGGLGQRLADDLQRDADHGKIAAGPGGLLPLLDGAEIRGGCGGGCRGGCVHDGLLHAEGGWSGGIPVGPAPPRNSVHQGSRQPLVRSRPLTRTAAPACTYPHTGALHETSDHCLIARYRTPGSLAGRAAVRHCRRQRRPARRTGPRQGAGTGTDAAGRGHHALASPLCHRTAGAGTVPDAGLSQGHGRTHGRHLDPDPDRHRAAGPASGRPHRLAAGRRPPDQPAHPRPTVPARTRRRSLPLIRAGASATALRRHATRI